MKNLFDSALVEDTKRRILQLHPDSERLWGEMSVAQMVSHCTSGIEMAMGKIHPKRAPFPASLVGVLIRPLALGDDKPFRRNSPSSPELFPSEPESCDLEHERAELIAAIDRFAAGGPACCSQQPHPFFGQLTPEQWAVLMYKHLDHHLRQFGV